MTLYFQTVFFITVIWYWCVCGRGWRGKKFIKIIWYYSKKFKWPCAILFFPWYRSVSMNTLCDKCSGTVGCRGSVCKSWFAFRRAVSVKGQSKGRDGLAWKLWKCQMSPSAGVPCCSYVKICTEKVPATFWPWTWAQGTATLARSFPVKHRKWLALDVFDMFAAHPILFHVTDTEYSASDGITHRHLSRLLHVKHIEGSKERYLLGWNTTCKFLG